IPMPVLFLKKVISLSSFRPRHLPFSKSPNSCRSSALTMPRSMRSWNSACLSRKICGLYPTTIKFARLTASSANSFLGKKPAPPTRLVTCMPGSSQRPCTTGSTVLVAALTMSLPRTTSSAEATGTTSTPVWARQIFACHRAGGADAQCGNVMVVHDRENFTGIHVEEHDETNIIAGIDAPFGAGDLHFCRETGVDAQRHRLDARHQPHNVIEIVLAAFFFPGGSEPRPRRVHRFALAQLAESLFDGIDLLRHRQEILHLLVFEDKLHRCVSFCPPSKKATGVNPRMNGRWFPSVALAKEGALR